MPERRKNDSKPQPTAESLLFDKGLPANPDAERILLGSILNDNSGFVIAAASLETGDFSIEKHRKIWERMAGLNDRGEKIDRVTLANELNRFNELESVDGLSYIVSLDEGLPAIENLPSYVKIVKDKSALRRIIYDAQRTMNRAFTQEESPKEIIEGSIEGLIELMPPEREGGLEGPEQVIKRFPGGVNAFLQPHLRPTGIGTGFYRFDEMSHGMKPGELIIIAARPSMGKTALALNIAMHNILPPRNKCVAVFSLEMGKESLLNRMICARAKVDSQKFQAGYLSGEERDRLRKSLVEINDTLLFIDDSSDITVSEMRAKCEKLKAEQGELDLVIADYLQLMTSRTKHENRNQEVTAMSRGMKILAKELGVPVLVLSQLSRAPELRSNPRPQLSDLRESGAIEQDADLVGFIFREEVYKRDREDLRGLAELIIGKSRNGPTGTVNLVFLHHLTQFVNRADDVQADLEGQ